MDKLLGGTFEFHQFQIEFENLTDDLYKTLQNIPTVVSPNRMDNIFHFYGRTRSVFFDAIKAANDISPAVVAGGISQALLTTAFGLIVAMIIQTFQNVFVARIDKLVLDMEEQSIKILDFLHEFNNK